MTAVDPPAASAAAPRAALRHLLRLERHRWPRLAAGGLAGLGASASAVALLACGAWLVARAAQQPPVVALSVAVVGVRAFAVARAALRYLERLLTHDATLRVLGDLRVTLYRRLVRLAPGGLRAFRSGDLLGRMVADLDAVHDVYLRALLPWLAGTAVALLSAAAVLLLLPSAAVVLLAATVLVAAVVPAATARASRRAAAGATAGRAELTELVVDTFDRLPELVAYGELDRRTGAIAATDAHLARHLDAAARVRGLGSGAVSLATGGAVWLVLVLAVPAVRSGALPVVALAVLALVPLALAEVFAPLPVAVAELVRSSSAAVRVDAVLHTPDPVREPGQATPLPDGPHHLRVHRMTAAWPAAQRPALQDLDLDLPPGRRVLVVGPSGSGKTTLAMVLLRFLDPSSGHVTLDGVDTRDATGDDVRAVVGLLAQDAHVFDTTVWENLRIGRQDLAPAQAADALHRAGLHDWVGSLPDGVHTAVGEHGSGMSGGERQRLALARLLVADRPVLVLDEPTEHLDPETADALLADLVQSTRGRTVVAVSHRLHGFETFDEVVVLDGGRVVERGRHRDLVVAGGPYARAYADEEPLATP